MRDWVSTCYWGSWHTERATEAAEGQRGEVTKGSRWDERWQGEPKGFVAKRKKGVGET